MTITTTTPHTVSLRPTSLVALLATTVAASIGATWGAVHVADGGPAGRGPAVSTVAPDTQAYIDGVTSMTRAQLAAAYGYNNYPDLATQSYIDGIANMTPSQLAAAYGYNNYPDLATQAHVDGIASMTRAQLAAAHGYNNYPELNAVRITTEAP